MAQINAEFRIPGENKIVIEGSYDKLAMESSSDVYTLIDAKYPSASGYTKSTTTFEELSGLQILDWWYKAWLHYYRGTTIRNNADGTTSVIVTLSEP